MNYTKITQALFVLLSLFSSFTWVNAQENLLEKEVSISFDNLSIGESLAKLEKKAGITTAYNSRELDDSKITITFEKELLKEVLDVLLKNENLSYKLIGNTITIFRNENVISQTISKTKTKPVQNETYTISGYIVDAESKEALIGANIYIPSLKIGVNTNEYGFYSITLPEGEYDLSISYIGYEGMEEKVVLNKNVELSISMSLGNELEEVIVTDDVYTLRHSESKMSTNKLSMEKLKSIPVLMGERDVLKLVQLMPGVQSGSEGNSGLYVRGGGPDQNLILLDGVPIYNVNHLFGFLSTLNGDAIKSAEIIKGGFPARYGGRLSSIMDVRMKEGNMEKFHGDISIGLVAGKFNLEGPIVKNKTSFHLSGRRTWLDALTTPIQKSIKQDDGNGGRTMVLKYNFYDLNAKVNHKFSDKSRLYLSFYQGDDNTSMYEKERGFESDTGIKWGNRIAALRWNYQISPQLFSNITLYNSAYKFKFNLVDKIGTATEVAFIDTFNSKSDIEDYAGKIDFNYLPSPAHSIRAGAGLVRHKFSPTVNKESFKEGNAPATDVISGSPDINSNELTAYVEDDISLGSKFKLNAGLHFAGYLVENSEYWSLQPRLAFSFLINDKSSLKLSYSKMTQFLHLLASPSLGLPTDLWVTSTDRIKPETSVQYALGYTRSLSKQFELTTEIYYKEMDNLLEYKSGFSIFSSSIDWQDKVLVGSGTSYGLEVLLEKTLGKTTGWIGYTLSKTERAFPDLDEGKAFPYKYDRRHDVSIALTHKKSKRVDFGLIWVYGSGNTYTLGLNNYNAITGGEQALPGQSLGETIAPVNNVTSRNNQRAPAYHRLDLSVNLHKEKKRGTRTWSLGLYNAYSRQNPWIIQLKERTDGSGALYLKQTSLIPVLPYFTYSFKF